MCQASSFQIQPTRVRLEEPHHALGATGGGLWVSSFVMIREIRLECCPWCLVRDGWVGRLGPAASAAFLFFSLLMGVASVLSSLPGIGVGFFQRRCAHRRSTRCRKIMPWEKAGECCSPPAVQMGTLAIVYFFRQGVLSPSAQPVNLLARQ